MSLFAALDCDAKDFDLRRVRPLLRDAANVNALVAGRTPLSVAVERKLTSAVRLLLDSGLVSDLVLPLIAAIRAPDLATVTLLLERGAPLNSVCAVAQTTPLAVAVQTGNAQLVTLLREFGADPLFDDSRALSLALELNEPAVVDALLADVKPIRKVVPPTTTTTTTTTTITATKRSADESALQLPPPTKKPSITNLLGMVSPVWQPGVPLEAFLAANRPSTADPFRVEWIYARSGQDSGVGEGDPAAAIEQYQRDTARGVPITASYLMSLAQQHGVLCGKWLVFARSDTVDAVWAGVARLVADGLVLTAKVGPRDPQTGQHVICVYVPDFGDERDVMRVRELLRTRCRLERKLSFKADLYTHLGIYAPQAKQLGISAAIYSA